MSIKAYQNIPEQGLGFQYVAELYDCAADLNDSKLIEEAALEVARLGKVTVVQEVTHQFSPHGVSCVLVLAESHLAIHTWPEFGYVALDLFTCEASVDGREMLARFKELLGASEVEVQFFSRGRPLKSK